MKLISRCNLEQRLGVVLTLDDPARVAARPLAKDARGAAPGLLVTMGCNGKGVAWNSAIGRLLADRCQGRRIPMPIEPIRRIPFRWARKLYTRAATAHHRWLDARG